MRLLLDESLPKPLVVEFPSDCDVSTVQEMGWAAYTNGDLLTLAADSGFDAFVTPDRNLEYQQNLAELRIRVVVLAARSTRLRELVPLVPSIMAAIRSVDVGELVTVTK